MLTRDIWVGEMKKSRSLQLPVGTIYGSSVCSDDRALNMGPRRICSRGCLLVSFHMTASYIDPYKARLFKPATKHPDDLFRHKEKWIGLRISVTITRKLCLYE